MNSTPRAPGLLLAGSLTPKMFFALFGWIGTRRCDVDDSLERHFSRDCESFELLRCTMDDVSPTSKEE
jgi:hypothetical protein